MVFTGLTALAMIASCFLVFVYAPKDKTMGISQKIFYLHVPIAWISLLAFIVIFVCSILYLAKDNILYDDITRASAKIGLVFNTLMLATGSIWGKSAWGTWWTWDPRLTSSLILWFIYVCYIVVRNSSFEGQRSSKFAAIIGIIGFADIPVIALATTLWPTLHPSEMIFQGGVTGPMLVTLIICIVAFTLFYLLLMILTVTIQQMEGITTEMDISSNSEELEENQK